MFVLCLGSSIRGEFCFSCNFLYFPRFPQWLAYNAYNQKQMRHSRHQGQEGLATSSFNLDGDRSRCYEPDVRVYGTHLCLPSLCTVQRHAVGVQILSLLYWNVFFFFFFLLCQRACLTDLLLYKYVVSRLRGNRWLFWTYKCQTGSKVHLF